MAKSGIYAFGVIYQTKVVYVYQDKIGHVEKGKISIWIRLSIFRVAEYMKVLLDNYQVNAIKIKEKNVLVVYEIVKSRFEVFVCEQKIIEDQEFDNKDKVSYHIMLKENDKVVAYCRIVPKEIGYDYTSIGRVLVLSSYRRKGIAQEMIKVALDFIKNNLNENIVVLSGQLYAKGLYESVGFNVISDVYDEVNIPHVKMKIEL